MKIMSIFAAGLAVALSASAASALPAVSMRGVQAEKGSALVQVKSMPSRSVYHSRSRHSGRGLRSNHRY